MSCHSLEKLKTSESESLVEDGNEGELVEVKEEDKPEVTDVVASYAPAIPEGVLSQTLFDDIKDKISESTMKAIGEMGFKHMTEIQSKSIPHLLEGR